MPVSSSELDSRSLRRRALWLALAALVSLHAGSSPAVVFYARDEALSLAFPHADRIETRDFFLTAEQRAAIEQRAKSKLESDLLTVYVGHQRESVSGYAVLDTHVVRTLPETFLIVLAADGRVTATHVLAFYEPTEYMPNERWLHQFNDQRDPKRLRVGREVAAITGSTLTSQAVTAAVRRSLAIYEVLLRSG